MQAQRAQLPDGRWHFQHGPMDIIMGAAGDTLLVDEAHDRAWQRFAGILQELVQELPLLRAPVTGECPVHGPVAQRMWRACKPYQAKVITPMAAVAGSVAQELLQFYQVYGIRRAWINNGGDMAIHLTANESVRVGLYTHLEKLNVRQLQNGIELNGRFEISSNSAVRGVATSGWRGRSFSLGIADSVTVLARTAAQADAAATVIANAVNVDDGCISRRCANSIKDDSDLGHRLVTVDVPPLAPGLVQQALAAGLACALSLRAQGLICAAVLVCQNQSITTDSTIKHMQNKVLTLTERGTENA